MHAQNLYNQLILTHSENSEIKVTVKLTGSRVCALSMQKSFQILVKGFQVAFTMW